MKKLSVIVPAFNEAATLSVVLEKIRNVVLIDEMTCEVIVVDDCSTDATAAVFAAYRDAHPGFPLQYLRNETNQGKGYSIVRGIQQASGDYVIVQDADLEYDPEEYNLLLRPMALGQADVVYGSRFMGGSPHRILFFWHSLGNRFLTFISNMATNLNLTDMETGYKLFRRELIAGIRLVEKRFGFEPEVTAKISRVPGIRIYEVGISYYGRTYAEGKKINWRDGLKAIYCILYYNYIRR